MSPNLATFTKRSYYGWVNMVTSAKRKQWGLFPPKVFNKVGSCADATMAVYEHYQEHFLHLIFCEMYRELSANHFCPSLRFFKKNLFTRWPRTFNPLTTARATIVAQSFFVITRQPLQLQRCSNPPRMRKIDTITLKNCDSQFKFGQFR